MVTALAGGLPRRRADTGHGHLFQTWMLAVTAGEFVGFSVPALGGALTIGAPTKATLLVLVVSGAVEGLILGTSQGLVMRRALPDLSLKRWVAATTAGAAVAWTLGLLPSATHELWSRWPLPAAVVAAVFLAGLLLCSIGTAQWWELRRHVAHARAWVWGTALAWALGLLAFAAITTPLWQAGQPQPVVVAVGTLGGLAMAATMAATSGLVLLHLLERRPRSFALRLQTHLVNPLVHAVLSSRMHRVLSGSTVLLTYAGSHSGRRYTVPVMYAANGADLVIVAGAHRKKVWWRNFAQPADVDLVLRGTRHRARARRVMLFDARYEHDLNAYRRRYPRARVAVGAPVIRVCLDSSNHGNSSHRSCAETSDVHTDIGQSSFGVQQRRGIAPSTACGSTCSMTMRSFA